MANRLDIEEIRRQVRVRRLLGAVPKGRWGAKSDLRAARLLAGWSTADRERFAREQGIEALTATQWKAFVWAVASRAVNACLAEVRL
jgi:hypothetical protein